MPDATVMLRALLAWLIIAAAEVLQGVLRVRFLNRQLGDHRARQVGVLTGCGLIFGIAWFSVPWIDARTWPHWVGVGLLWFALMLTLDLGFGRLVFRAPWSRIAADFDPRRGNFLGFGMLFVFAAPLLVAKLRGLI
jgi:hypothetical protein